jgi:hypothetical protein
VKHPRLARALAAAVGVALVAPAVPVGAQPSSRERARAATRYLANAQEDDGSIALFSELGDTADAVAVMALTKRGPRQIDRAIRYLRSHLDEADTIGLVAKVVMAVVSSGRDPRDFGGRDLVAELRASQTAEGQFGGESDAEVYYHSLAVLALSAAGEEPPAESATWLLAARCGDGGWQFDEPSSEADDEHCRESEDDFAGSDTNTSSYAVQALRVVPGPEALEDTVEFLRSAQDPVKNGFVYDPTQKCTEETVGSGCYLTDSNSTSLVMQALLALEEQIPVAVVRALYRLQYPLCGPNGAGVAFTWDYDPDTERFSRQPPNVGSTIAAIPAMLAHVYPLPAREATKPPPRLGPC